MAKTKEGLGDVIFRRNTTLFFILLAVGGHLMEELVVKPNGELPAWFALKTCLNRTASFDVNYDGRGTFDAYTLSSARGLDAQEACPLIGGGSGSDAPLEIYLEETDGYRSLPSTYRPVFALPATSYALIAFGIVDAAGEQVYEPTILSLGPDERCCTLALST